MHQNDAVARVVEDVSGVAVVVAAADIPEFNEVGSLVGSALLVFVQFHFNAATDRPTGGLDGFVEGS